MQTRVLTDLVTGEPAATAQSIKNKLHTSDAPPALVMVFASTKQPLSELIPALVDEFPTTHILSASTAGEFIETGDAKGAVAVFALWGDFEVFAGMGEGLKEDVDKAVRDAGAELPAGRPDYPHRTALLLLDPLAGVSEEATLLAATLIGADIPLAGGAAGDDLTMSHTPVGLGKRIAANAVVTAVIFSKKPLGLGVCHGHEPLSKRLKITKATANVVHEIDDEPAWTVWKKATREAAKARGVDPEALGPDEIGPYLLRYEAGLSTGSEYKIRAPLSVDDEGGIAFACGIPQGAVIQITESEPSRQIDSARSAAQRAREGLAGERPAGALVFDCICRNLILGPQFGDAVHAISEELGNAPLAGFETYGEIALAAGDLSGFHNTTTVVLAFPA